MDVRPASASATPYPVSAIHGRGSGDLLDALVDALPPSRRSPSRTPTDDGIFSVAIVGRPNVGKSTLFNRLVGDERSVVHDMPGTTRDAIDTIVETEDGPLRFVDTAGMRRRSRIDEPTEYFSLVRALEAVDRADAALLVIDAPEGVTPPGPAPRRAHRRRRHRDRRRAQQVGPARRRSARAGAMHRRRRPARRSSPTRPCSRSPRSTRPMMQQLLPALRAGRGGVPPPDPDRGAQPGDPRGPGSAPAARRRARTGPRVLYATQGATDPPTFTLFATHELPPTYLRYLERKIRESFDLGPTPIKLRVRRRNG